ncbi:hypothetical protein LshimejAT787_1701390 [Lyophyllum shimeji]|uniref:Uncharacterized protein n=1 Tax=Lyophyllum shimeji TaxID=47721 RepID=A0A9P3PWY1_LYOSH|nr:hypothetical protein LshimejAT787_1701390 [Lyophyllum shimeji]
MVRHDCRPSRGPRIGNERAIVEMVAVGGGACSDSKYICSNSQVASFHFQGPVPELFEAYWCSVKLWAALTHAEARSGAIPEILSIHCLQPARGPVQHVLTHQWKATFSGQ